MYLFFCGIQVILIIIEIEIIDLQIQYETIFLFGMQPVSGLLHVVGLPVTSCVPSCGI